MGKLSWVGGLGGFNGSDGGGNGAQPAASPSNQDWSPRLVVTATLVALGIAAVFLLLFRFYSVVFLFLVAIMLGIATKPVVGWLQKRGVRPEIGVILVYLVLLALAALFLVIVAPLIAEQATSVVDRLPEYYTQLRQALIDSNNRLVQRVALGLPITLSFSIGSMVQSGTAQGGDAAAAAVDFLPALRVIGNVVQGVFVLIAILALAFFWVQEGDILVRRILLLFPLERREPGRELYLEMEGKVAAYFRGQIILCGVVGLMSLIGYAAIGLPYALGLALIMAVCEAIPMVGPLIGAVPVILVALATAPEKVIWTIAIIFVIQTSENNLLVPRIMDRSVGINPIITILGIAAFGALFGFAGALLAVPLTAMVQIVASRIMFREPSTPEVSRGKAGILRLAAQELVQDVRKSSRIDSEETKLLDPEVERAEDLLEGIAVDLDKVLTDHETAESGSEGDGGGVR